MNHYSIPSERILVRYSPKKIASVLSDNEENLCPKGNYILLVGGNRWVKNAYRAILAIDGLITDGKLKDYKVAVVGNLSKSIRRKIGNPESFVLLDYISSGQLEELYKNCNVFVYPSLNEGFGYSPLEALLTEEPALYQQFVPCPRYAATLFIM